eukprot:6153-Amphidinium_carterae.1
MCATTDSPLSLTQTSRARFVGLPYGAFLMEKTASPKDTLNSQELHHKLLSCEQAKGSTKIIC